MYIHIYIYVLIHTRYEYMYIINTFIELLESNPLKSIILVLVRRLAVIEICFGWHHLSKATCLIRPHLLSTALLV